MGLAALHAVTKSFRAGGAETVALRGVDLAIDDGELLMLVGPSGCGKTTLLSVLAGILRADGGTVAVLGHDLATLPSRELLAFRRRHLGFVFQAYNLIPALDVVENVAVPLILDGVPRAKALSRAADLVGALGLGDRRRHLPNQLSGGQQQRVAIARALVHGPMLVVCDEPTSALDHATGTLVMDVLRETAVGPGRGLVVVTHDARIFPYADRVARMEDGLVTAIETRHASETSP
ncbi:MAG TPA: ABC transporter ATP-binding protein [Planctomycetota bacterium]|nr:ABC transporter ATP-binding protein [Planctomycetota bacterium]